MINYDLIMAINAVTGILLMAISLYQMYKIYNPDIEVVESEAKSNSTLL